MLQLWSTVRVAFGDYPDLVELAEKLSQNFEFLYKEEVGTLVVHTLSVLCFHLLIEPEHLNCFLGYRLSPISKSLRSMLKWNA